MEWLDLTSVMYYLRNYVKGKTQNLNKWSISSVFQNDDDGAMLQDILRYFSVNPNTSENTPFELRSLQLWIVENNREIIEEYQDSKGHTSASNKVHAKESRINRIFNAAIILGLIKRKSNNTSDDISTPESMYTEKVQYVYTKSGILLSLIIRNVNLESISQRKIENKKGDLD